MGVIDRFIHRDCQWPSDVRYRARILAVILLSYVLIATVYSAYIAWSDSFPTYLKTFSLALLLPSCLFYAGLVCWLKFRGGYQAVAQALVLSSALPIVVSLYFTGGPAQSPATQTLLIPVVIAFCLCGARFGLFWAAALLTVCYALVFAGAWGLRFPNLVAPTVRDTSIVMNWTLAYVAVVVVVMVYEAMNRNLAQERDRERDRLAHVASHDMLTGLANRTRFQERWQEAMQRARRHGRGVALVYIDLDEFKPINDQLGHAAGDWLLQQVASRLETDLRTTDFVARLGGDEFAVILEDVAARLDAQRIAEQLQVSIGRPFNGPHGELRIGASLGVALYPDDGGSVEAVISRADAQMYERKRDSRRTTVVAD